MAGTHVSVSSGRGYAKVPYGSYAGRLPSITVSVSTDLDRGGIPRQWVMARFGPGIGRVRIPLQSRYLVTTVGNIILDPSITVVEVNAPGPVRITLPSANNPVTIAQERLFAKVPVVISDISGAAATNPITILPAAGETIMGLSSLVISTNYGGATLEPSATLLGWNLIAP